LSALVVQWKVALTKQISTFSWCYRMLFLASALLCRFPLQVTARWSVLMKVRGKWLQMGGGH